MIPGSRLVFFRGLWVFIFNYLILFDIIMKYNHSGNFEVADAVNFEHPIGISLTVPDQTMSIEELLKRNVRGLPVPAKEGVYNEDFVPDFKHMDLAERDDYLENLKEQNVKMRDIAQSKLDERKSKRQADKDALRSKGTEANDSPTA